MQKRGFYLHRVLIARMIDRLFYEPHNLRRCHARGYALLGRELCGISLDSFRHYLQISEEKLGGHSLRSDIEQFLIMIVLLTKAMPLKEVTICLKELNEHIRRSLDEAGKRHGRVDAGLFMKYLKSSFASTRVR